jgi:hypothetical protein
MHTARDQFISRLAFAAVIAAGASGCQMHPMPSSLLPSLATARQDRAITAHAAKSGFPSPSDVGLQASDDSAQ